MRTIPHLNQMNKLILFPKLILLLVLAVHTSAEGQDSNKKHLFILSGQSNMTPGLAASFTNAVEGVLGKEKVLSVHYNRPGWPIKHWYVEWTPPAGSEAHAKGKASKAAAKSAAEPNGSAYKEMIAKTKAAIKEQSISTVTLIWMQGETDANFGWGGVYEKSFLGLLEQIKTDLGVSQVSFVVGRINDYWLPPGYVDGNLMRDIQVKLGDTHPNGAWVDTDDLNRGVNPWGGYFFNDGHFPQQGYRVLGQRFARKAIGLVDPARKIDEKFFDLRFLNTADDIKSNLALSKKVTGSTPDKGVKELTHLVDGQYGSTKPQDGKWVGFGVEQKTVDLIVDIGNAEMIQTLGVNVLLNPSAQAEPPLRIQFSLSEDGNTYLPISTTGKEGVGFFTPEVRSSSIKTMDPQSLLVIVDAGKIAAGKGNASAGTNARFVKVTMTMETQDVYVDEILVNPIGK
jgi:hypothetical protein